ncbi:hypothetical protein MT355_15325 [Rathayibacter sp. VKM Ac-2929]|uniref:hypothetical protein n=1 Tax=Rathayibacter sp. VKM Ac-2929 TaxID=2929480 RepID=UPI001FB3EB6E|nr:hypothetical protein [Rathayibacter sp. VKM Ac-2929]MCJ1674630.1 hypothetical protein [Rathayibacter sp. VKM Ac-2929]
MRIRTENSLRSSVTRALAVLSIVAIATSLSGCSAGDAAPPKPTVPPLPAAEVERALVQKQDAAWELLAVKYPNAVRPEVDVIRTVNPAESTSSIADCMVSAGFPETKAGPDGGLDYGSFPTEQTQTHDIALFVCRAQYPMDPRFDTPPTEAQYEYLYHYFAHDLTECLESHGIDVPEAPTYETFRDTINSREAWSPYLSYEPTGNTQWLAVNTDCPQMPPGYFGE